MAEIESGWKGMDRRTFLKGAAGGAGALFVSSQLPEFTLAGNCKLPERIDGLKDSNEAIGALKQLIEERFRVRAIPTSEAYSLLGQEDTANADVQIFGMIPRMWTEPTLKLLYNVLSVMPEEFTVIHRDQQVQVSLDNVTVTECQCGGMYMSDLVPADDEVVPDVIIVDPGYFVPTNDPVRNQKSVRTLGHELIHRFDLDVLHKAAWEHLDTAFGGKEFTELAGDIRGRIAAVGSVGLQPAEEVAASRLSYGFGEEQRDFREVTASLGEMYFYGENFFNKGMSVYLGRETAASVYDVLRNDIFMGKEYPAFPQICT